VRENLREREKERVDGLLWERGTREYFAELADGDVLFEKGSECSVGLGRVMTLNRAVYLFVYFYMST
jgi:hypothetical protein